MGEQDDNSRRFVWSPRTHKGDLADVDRRSS